MDESKMFAEELNELKKKADQLTHCLFSHPSPTTTGAIWSVCQAHWELRACQEGEGPGLRGWSL